MYRKEMKDVLEKNVVDYAKYTITDRAIVNLSDGLKNIHRRIIWSMYLDGLLYNKDRTKSVNAVGSVLRFSPHGDSSVYQACVRLANDSVMYPLIDGKGSFSSITSRDVHAGASRYTEMRLSPITQEILKDINKNVVDMVNNYDDTRLEPTDMPVTFPLVLANCNLGIAVGIASNICSFNLNDIIDNTINILKNKETFTMIPDFSTKGLILYNSSVLEQIKDTGTGTIYLRAKYHIEDNSIVITEIPYTTTKEAIIESVINLVKKNNFKEILDINDYSGVDGLNITIDVKRNTNMDLLMQKLYKSTPLQSSFSCNFTVLVDNKPYTLGTDNILKEWIEFRKKCIKRGVKFDLDKKQSELHFLNGLSKILLDIDKTIEIIRKSENEANAINDLKEYFKIDDKQAEYIASIKLININKNYILKKISDIQTLETEIKTLNETLNNEDSIKEIIISQLEDIKKKYGRPRMTEIIKEDTIQEVSATDLIEDYSTYCILTKEGYLKKLLRKSDNIKLKEGDEILSQTSSSNKSTLLLLTNKGTCYKIYQHEISECRPSELGLYLPQHLQLDKDEKVIAMVSTRKYEGYVIMAYENNKIAKIDLKSFKTKTLRSKLENALSQESLLINLFAIQDDTQLLCKSSIDKVLIINTADINSKASKNSSGNMVLKSKNNSTMVMCELLDNIKGIEDINYYTGKPNSVGCYLKKTDSINLNQ